MYPGEQVQLVPEQTLLYARGNQGTGALPTAAQSITLITFTSLVRGRENYINPVDGATKQITLPTSGFVHGIRRFVGLYLIDVFLFQDVAASISLRERPPDHVTQALPGSTDTFRAVWTRQIRPSIAFRATWRIEAAEGRLVYLNGATNTAQFALSVIARPL